MATNGIKVYPVSSKKELKQVMFHREQQRDTHFVIRVPKDLIKLGDQMEMSLMVGWMMPLVQCGGMRVTQLGAVVDLECSVEYRTGVRMHDAWRKASTEGLTELEIAGLRQAEKIVAAIRQKKKSRIGRLSMLYKVVSEQIDYKRGEWGKPEFNELISCAHVLKKRQGNCQGFADVMYLLGGMLGFAMGIQNGRSPADDHSWSTVRLDGCCYALDASAAALARMVCGNDCDYSHFLMGMREVDELGLTWRLRDQSLFLSPELLPEHDFYCNGGFAVDNVKEAAKLIWTQVLHGKLSIPIKIRQNVAPDTLQKEIYRLDWKLRINLWLLAHADGKHGFQLLNFRRGKNCTWCTVKWDQANESSS